MTENEQVVRKTGFHNVNTNINTLVIQTEYLLIQGAQKIFAFLKGSESFLDSAFVKTRASTPFQTKKEIAIDISLSNEDMVGKNMSFFQILERDFISTIKL